MPKNPSRSPELPACYAQVVPGLESIAAEEIASAVAFLASAEANYITGQVLCVDGGIVM